MCCLGLVFSIKTKPPASLLRVEVSCRHGLWGCRFLPRLSAASVFRPCPEKLLWPTGMRLISAFQFQLLQFLQSGFLFRFTMELELPKSAMVFPGVLILKKLLIRMLYNTFFRCKGLRNALHKTAHYQVVEWNKKIHNLWV